MAKGINLITEDCDPSSSQDKSLPTSAYMVEYLIDGISKYDLVVSGRKVEIFDEYYDKY